MPHRILNTVLICFNWKERFWLGHVKDGPGDCVSVGSCSGPLGLSWMEKKETLPGIGFHEATPPYLTSITGAQVLLWQLCGGF